MTNAIRPLTWGWTTTLWAGSTVPWASMSMRRGSRLTSATSTSTPESSGGLWTASGLARMIPTAASTPTTSTAATSPIRM